MRDQAFYGHGKLLLTGEYLVNHGARALALPASVGQSMKVKYRHSYQPTLNWRSVDHRGVVWFESDYEFWHFRPIKNTGSPEQDFVRQVLSAVRLQNPHFLRDDMDVMVETKIEFPMDWCLGSSSTFLYNVAQWAYVSPFELLKQTIGGSGYDIACAQALGPIKFQNLQHRPQWETVDFNPLFKDQLYFVFLGRKTSLAEESELFERANIAISDLVVNEISQLTLEILAAANLVSFSKIIKTHEEIMASLLKCKTIKEELFSDYWGEVKSIGAWGGQFALVTSDRGPEETREYFYGKGLQTILPYCEIVFEDHSLGLKS
jgi:mevalonate kinase